MKLVVDTAVCRIQFNRLFLRSQIANESPLIALQSFRRRVAVTFVDSKATARTRILGALVANLVLAQSQVLPIGGGFRAGQIERNQLSIKRPGSGSRRSGPEVLERDS